MLNRANTRTVWRTCSPGLESVVLRSRSASDATAEYTDYTLYHVQVELIGYSEGAVSGVVQSRLKRRLFSIFQDDLDQASAPAPKVGDLISQTDDGEEWVIQDVGESLLGNEFPCTCQERA